MNTLPKIGAIFYILLACLLIIPHPVNSQSDPPRSGIWYASQSIAKESKLAFPPLPTESTFPNIKVNQDNSGRPQNETSIIFNETNFYNLVGGANDYRLTFASPGYYYSTDGGQTWDDGLLPLGGSYDAGGDPALACDANGNIYYAHISFDYGVGGSDFPDNGLFVNRSTDGGATWMSSPFIVAQNGDGTGTTYDQPYFEDKPYIACDALAQSSYQNTAYVSWTKYFQEGTPTQIYFSRLVPGQPGFSTGIQISDAGYAQGSIPAVGPGGIVYVIWFKITGSFQGTLQLDQSDDGGSTFGTDQTIVDGISRLYDVKGTIRANNYPAAAVDNSGSDYNGYVYVVWTDKRLGDPDIYFTRGIPQVNGQLQWDNPKRVNNDTPGNGKDQWFPWITVASDGTIYIVYYDSRADANNILTDVYVATSFDAGENFYQEKVNTQSFDPRIGFNGSFMGDYNGITALPEQAYPFWTDMRSGNDQDVYVALYDRPVVEVTVDQKLDTGTRVGTIGRWNGASFDPRFTPPQVLPLDLGTTEVFHGDTLIYSGQKYHRWNDDPDVTNHHVFDIDLNFPNFLTSNFEPTHNGVVIKNDLISAPNQDGGTIDFKDPWFIDYPDPAYGNNKRNRGMDEALYKPQSSPFNPNTNPTGSGSEYKGVFLNQGGSDPQNPIPPYYSVRILQTQTIPFHGQNITWYFQGWEGDAVDFEAAEATETAVIFRDANAEARAVYKGHLASSNPAATAHNNGRRVVRDGEGTLHAVYEDGGQIWYTYSTTNGKTWVAEARLNEINFPEDQNLYPAIAEFQGALHVVWTTLNYYDQELLGIYIRYRSKEAGGQWQDILDAAPAYPPPVQATPKPAIEVWYSGAAGGTAVICYNHPNQPEDIITRYWDSSHFVTSATMATGSDPSLGSDVYRLNLRLSYDHENQIYLSKWNTANKTWYGPEPVTDEVWWMAGNRYSNHTYSEGGFSQIVWYGRDDALVPIVAHRSYKSPQNPGEVSYFYTSSLSSLVYPSVAESSGQPLIFYEEDGEIVKQVFDGEYWLKYRFEEGRYPNAAAHGQSGAIWSAQNTAPYQIVSDYRKQAGYEMEVIIPDTMLINKRFDYTFVQDSAAGYLTLEVQSLAAGNKRLQLDTLLNSRPVAVSPGLSLEYQLMVRFHQLKFPPDSQAVLFNLGFDDGKGVSPLANLRLKNLLHLNNGQPHFLPVTIPLVQLQGKTGRFKIRFGEVHPVISNMVVSPATKQAKIPIIPAGIEENLPEAFHLSQNYPNPFNPSTTITFSLPQDAPVNLQVYDITGRKVRTLADHPFSAGVHQVVWDGRNDDGAQVSSGVYIYRVQAGKFTQNRKMVLMR